MSVTLSRRVPDPHSASARADAIRVHLERQGSPDHAAGVQWYFKEDVQSYGWYSAALRAYARDVYVDLGGDLPRLMDITETLFRGRTIEEKAIAVLILERALPFARTAKTPSSRPPRRPVLGDAEFARLTSWLDHVASWADHDALAMYLLGPLFVAVPSRVRHVTTWARSPNRWHRRAAAVSLIHGIRRGLFVAEATRIARRLAGDEDDMVQKGLGWLLREWGKAQPGEVVPILMELRTRTSRLVLRTACERLPAADRLRVLAK